MVAYLSIVLLNLEGRLHIPGSSIYNNKIENMDTPPNACHLPSNQ